MEPTRNPEHLREIDRTIVAAIIFSSDGYILMGKKNPNNGGVYPDAWHIPGGGVGAGETLDEALIREISEEVVGLVIKAVKRTQLPNIGHGESIKTLKSGERVWCRMEFNRFEVHLDNTAAELAERLQPGDDLVKLHWFGPQELAGAKQIPGGKEFFEAAGYIKPVS